VSFSLSFAKNSLRARLLSDGITIIGGFSASMGNILSLTGKSLCVPILGEFVRLSKYSAGYAFKPIYFSYIDTAG